MKRMKLGVKKGKYLKSSEHLLTCPKWYGCVMAILERCQSVVFSWMLKILLDLYCTKNTQELIKIIVRLFWRETIYKITAWWLSAASKVQITCLCIWLFMGTNVCSFHSILKWFGYYRFCCRRGMVLRLVH